MSEVVIQSGTRDELAGVTVGSGNVWVRPGHHTISVEVALPDQRVILAVGDSLELGGRRCTLERIEPLASGGAHNLHFRTEAIASSAPATTARHLQPGAGSAPDAQRRTPSERVDAVAAADVSTAGPGNPAAGLRRASPALFALIRADRWPGADEWARTEREEWVEIDRVPCGPNTTTTWTWKATDGLSASGLPSTRAEVCEVVMRTSPDEIREIRLSGAWHHGPDRLLVSFAGHGPVHHLRVTGPAGVVERALALTLSELGPLQADTPRP